MFAMSADPAGHTLLGGFKPAPQAVEHDVVVRVLACGVCRTDMGDGFRVGVRIITDSIEPAVVVPVGAVLAHGEGMAAYRLEAGKARLQAVEVGARNATLAWVRQGLAPGQTVVVYPPAALADGRKVRVRRP